MAGARTIAKSALLRVVASVTGRHPVLLPRAAASDADLLPVAAPYRVDGRSLALEIGEPDRGTLTIALLVPQRPNAWRAIWRSSPTICSGPEIVYVDLSTGQVRIGTRDLGRFPIPLPSRRFSWRLEFNSANGGGTKARTTGHYLVGDGTVDDSYYAGDNYVDYEAESLSTRQMVLQLSREYPFRATALEIGCATGGLLDDLRNAGFDAVGVDFSAWAVERARERVGNDRVFQLDVERDLSASPLIARAPFGALIMLSVLEHFADPFGVLERLSALVAPGGRLILTTTNSDGLGHRLFGPDWEGYFDWTHQGVDRVSAGTLRHELQRLGWSIDMLETSVVWDGNADPTHATLREWYASDARFRRLLIERDAGDLITCVATRT